MLPLTLLLLYTVCEYTAYIPQILKLIRTKSANDLSKTTWVTWVVSAVCYLVYVLLESPQFGVIYIASMNLIFIMTVCVLTVYYQKAKKFQKPCKSKIRK